MRDTIFIGAGASMGVPVMGSGQRLHVTLRLCYVDGQVEVDLDDSLFKLSAVLLLYVRF
jgi:hypothetical protein